MTWEKWKERVMAVLTTTPDPKYINNQQMHYNIDDEFYSQCSQNMFQPVFWPSSG
jgi:hypothetical protein